MGTKPGVGEDSVILDLPSEAGTAVETDQMLSALAPSSRDFVERVPVIAQRGAPTAAAGRSAKTRVAGVPVLESHGTSVQPSPFLPSGPSMAKRMTAFGASLGLSFIVGLPAVLHADGLFLAPAPGTTAAQPVQSTPVAPPQTAAVAPPSAQLTQATAAPPASAAQVATVAVNPPPPSTTKGVGPKSSTGPAKPTAAPVTPPAGPATAPVAVTTTPAAATTPAPATTLPHGALIQ